MKQIAIADDSFIGFGGRRLAAVCSKDKLQRILAYMADENEFLSPYGIRSLSKHHLEHPFQVQIAGHGYKLQYLPAEANISMFGGNSNWRGPVWMPMNGLIIRGLIQMYPFYGPDFKVECPTGSGQYMTLYEIAKEIAARLSSIFLRDENGRRPFTEITRNSRKTRTGVTIFSSTSTSMGITVPGWEQATRQVGLG
jgi:hypothetical protein